MSVEYRAIGWNSQKKTYDATVALVSFGYLAAFTAVGAWIHPSATSETLLIRGFGTLALLMLQVILMIGPLCRLDRRFLPLLYNRRHLGVAMFLAALIHGTFSLVQFHALGDTNPFVSLLISNTRFRSVADFPFEILGLAALFILFLMAATSHDFWLHNLSPRIWKPLHMMVYIAYGLIVAHVCLGVLQTETSPVLVAMLGLGASVVCGLHLAAALREQAVDSKSPQAIADGFADLCALATIPDDRARVFTIGGERVAVFRQQNKVSALSNVCRHQNGPLGEGRIVNGCVTCPWHGYQYDPDTGMPPPPFNDKVNVFPVRVIDGRVWVRTCPK
jgi:nitrite reductase/ring-hydroxylating ferredoxin subunit/DMSO/TMAO reductase YedYZ heme-binding membrane subunit